MHLNNNCSWKRARVSPGSSILARQKFPVKSKVRNLEFAPVLQVMALRQDVGHTDSNFCFI